jgi:serine/threonine protein kinase/tetratricopeptide (TPR) repeat protein
VDEERIFSTALECVTPEARRAYVNEACAGDAELLGRVEGLLHAHEHPDSFLQPPDVDLAGKTEESCSERPGTMIGPYKLLEPIGEGGMGLVYVAEQQQPIKRRVALKLIKPGMDSRQVIARFEGERQALALMDHPHIAKVHDGGTTPDGRPYFVMEWVRGTPITEYCDTHRLSTRQRLELFLDVCHAVQHAHQKGIIHRDLKPSNVLVEVHDVRPVVKVIDFGIAKATGQQLTDKTLYTSIAQLVGTPLYMSPEQAGLSSLDVDTRSDVYSLGVLLYELLTGTTPFDEETLKKAGYDEMRRIIRDDEPPTPSTRLSTMEQKRLSTIAERRGLEPHRLSKQIRGELDWIVMKALEKDRNRRYESASAFAADVQRYLEDEPVQACPPAAAYRARKFIRRHRTVAIATGVVLLSLLGSTIGAVWGLVRADKAWQSEQRRADGEQAAKEAAQEREQEKEAVLEFVEQRVFAAARPERQDGGLGHDVSLRRAVEASLPFVERSFRDQPLIEGRLRMTLAVTFRYLGDAKTAAEQYQAARALYTEYLGPDHADTVRCMNGLANSYLDLGRHDDAFKLSEETLALAKAKLGPDHRNTLASMCHLASTYGVFGRYAEALKLREEVLALSRFKLGPDHPDTLLAMSNLATCYQELGRHAKALRLFDETLALQKAKLGADHPSVLTTRTNLANLYSDLGRHSDALKLQEETLALSKAKLGADHRDTLMDMNNLAETYRRLNRQADAFKLFQETLALEKAKLGPDDPVTLMTMDNLALSYGDLGRHEEALKLRQETLGLYKDKLGLNHPNTIKCVYYLAGDYYELGRHAEAIKLYQETLALQKAKLGSDSSDALTTMTVLATRYYELGRYAEALNLREEMLAIGKAKLGPDHPDVLLSMNNLAWLLAVCPDAKFREPRRAVVLAEKATEAPEPAAAWNTLGVACYRTGDWKKAITAVEKSMALQNGGDGNDWIILAMAHWQLGDMEKARKYYSQSVAWMKKQPSVDADLARFQAEAAALLGMKDGATPTPQGKASGSAK